MIYAAASAVINLVLGLVLFKLLGFWGLAVATSFAGWVNVFFLTRTLLRQGNFAPDARLLSRLPRIAIASALMGALVWLAANYLTPALGGGLLKNYSLLALVSGGGLLFYALAALALRAYGISDIRYALSRK